ncbi:MAG: M56 family metallopeptidase [Victivallaceae bacterium]|nr:M56 family metallopeptidase [Victivallaceae bacterium]
MSMAILWYVLTGCIRGAMVVLVIMLTELVLRRKLMFAGLRGLYLAAILLVILPVGFMSLPDAPARGQGMSTLESGVAMLTEIPSTISRSANIRRTTGGVTRRENTTRYEAAPAEAPKTTAAMNIFDLAMLAYAVIVAVLWAKQFAGYFIWLRRTASCPDIAAGRLFTLFTTARETAGCAKLSVVLKDGGTRLPEPASFGFGRHRAVFCPLARQNDFSDAEWRMLFTHEIEHLKRGDNAVNFLLCLLESLLFPNVFLRMLANRFRLVCELDCDAAVRRSPGFDAALAAVYSRLLLAFRAPGTSATLGLGAAARRIKIRIGGINLETPKNHRKIAMAALTAAIAATCFAPSAFQALGAEEIEFIDYAKARLAPFNLDIPDNVWTGGGVNGEPSPTLAKLIRYEWKCDADGSPLADGNQNAAELIDKICDAPNPIQEFNWDLSEQSIEFQLERLRMFRMAARFDFVRLRTADNGKDILNYISQEFRLSELAASGRLIVSALTSDAILCLTCEESSAILHKLSLQQLDELDAMTAEAIRQYRHDADSCLATELISFRNTPTAKELINNMTEPKSAAALRQYADNIAELVAIRQLPLKERDERANAFFRKLADASQSERMFEFFAYFEKAETAERRTDVRLALLRCAIAMEKQRRADGAYPSIIPGIDPYSGQPFKFKDGTLYSVGGNGIDDGAMRPMDHPDVDDISVHL